MMFLYLLFAVTSCPLTAFSDEGDNYVGQWKQVGAKPSSSEMGSNVSLEVKRNGTVYIFVLNTPMTFRYVGTMQPDGTIDVDKGVGKAIIEQDTGYLLFGGTQFQKKSAKTR